MILMKIVPGIPGHFSGYEWLALAIWSLIGLSLNWRRRPVPAASEHM
jgi:CHASE2 domain-containing sensor protein